MRPNQPDRIDCGIARPATHLVDLLIGILGFVIAAVVVWEVVQ